MGSNSRLLVIRKLLFRYHISFNAADSTRPFIRIMNLFLHSKIRFLQVTAVNVKFIVISIMARGLHAGMYSCFVLFLLVQSSDEAVRFTKHPVSKLYVLKGHTAKFTWDYHVDNINKEFDLQSPRWYYQTDRFFIGYGDAFDGRRFKINSNTCPARLRTPTVRVSVQGNATLVITNVTLADSGTYVCRLFLSSGRLSSMPTSKTQLIVEVARFTNVPANKLYVVKGKTVKFTWDYQAENINTEFDSQSPRWYFHNYSYMIGYADAYDGRRFKIGHTCPARLRTPTVRVSLEDKATLVIKNVALTDSGTYECLLFLLSGSLHSMPTSQVELIVTENPSFTLKPNHKAIAIESSYVSFNCAAVGIPTPNVTWVQVTKGITISKGQGTAVLLLPNINRSQSGEYECQAVNNPNEAPVIAKTMVTVYYKPTVGKASSTTNISSWAGNKINLECYWSSSLPIPRWTWYKPNGDTITTNVRSISNGSEVTVLTGNNNHDYGMYRCEATNIAGSDHHNISVTRLFPPGRIQLIEVASIRSSSVTIIWARPADNGGSPVTTYKVLIDSKTFHINSSKLLAYQEITGLQEQTEYKITVLAGNVAGYGDASIKVFNTTIQEPKRESCTASSQHSSVSDTKIGILAAFLALSLITIVILLAFIVWKHRMTNSQNTKQEQKNEQVYENADAIGMGPLTSPSRHPLQSKEKPKPDKTPANTNSRNQDQEHYQQLNPATLQKSTSSSSTYEPLRKGLTTH